METLEKIVSSVSANCQIQKQKDAGNVIISIIYIKNKKVQSGSNHIQDLTACGISPREYVIDKFHDGSTFHYYIGMENDPASYYCGKETIDRINKTTLEIENLIASGVNDIVILWAESRKKITHSKCVMSREDFKKLVA